MREVIPGCDMGLYAECQVCNRQVFIPDPMLWTFKITVPTGKGGVTTKYLCSYTCSQKHKKIQADKVKERLDKRKKGKGLEALFTAELLDDLYWNQGLSVAEMAERYHVSRTSVEKYLNLHGITYNSKGRERPYRRMPREIKDD